MPPTHVIRGKASTPLEFLQSARDSLAALLQRIHVTHVADADMAFPVRAEVGACRCEATRPSPCPPPTHPSSNDSSSASFVSAHPQPAHVRQDKSLNAPGSTATPPSSSR
eukprot:scaffold3440_cov316-Prasinococcus_capsulatus_cf.AAC.8